MSKSLKHSLGVIWLLALQLVFIGLYFEGTRSFLRSALGRSAGGQDGDWRGVAAVGILVIFAFAWRKDRRIGIAIQIVALALIVGWAAKADPSVLRNWIAYTPVVMVVAVGMALIVSAILWTLASRRAPPE